MKNHGKDIYTCQISKPLSGYLLGFYQRKTHQMQEHRNIAKKGRRITHFGQKSWEKQAKISHILL
jgi:hypothetical protein